MAAIVFWTISKFHERAVGGLSNDTWYLLSNFHERAELSNDTWYLLFCCERANWQVKIT